MRLIKNPKPNEFVLVTRWFKDDLGDPWAMGFFSHKKVWPNGRTSYFVTDSNGELIKYPSYYRCYRITEEEAVERWKAYKLQYPELPEGREW